MHDGSVVDTDLAKANWSGQDGRNLYRSRKGRYYLEYGAPRPHVEWISREEAARWFRANNHALPEDLGDLQEEI
jgi:hypothetical protein